MNPAEEANQSRRKRRKVGEITGPSSKSSPDNNHDDMLPENCSTSSPALQPLDDTQQKLGIMIIITEYIQLQICILHCSDAIFVLKGLKSE